MGLTPGRFPSPFRYPGGKGKIANYLKMLIVGNGLEGGEYIEPYAGGAAAALHLLFEDFVDHIHINDLDPALVAFWHCVLHDTERLIELIWRAKLTMNEWERQRSIQQDLDRSDLELAFATFYMNRTNRSGIVTAGPIGGAKQDGRWSIAARFNKDDLVRRIAKIARFRNRISLTGLDAADVISDWQSVRRGKYLLYADPPYYTRGGQLYLHDYGPADHERVANEIWELSIPWIVSYDNGTRVKELYSTATTVEYSLSYSAADRYKGAEIMFLSPGLAGPNVASPANLPLSALSL